MASYIKENFFNNSYNSISSSDSNILITNKKNTQSLQSKFQTPCKNTKSPKTKMNRERDQQIPNSSKNPFDSDEHIKNRFLNKDIKFDNTKLLDLSNEYNNLYINENGNNYNNLEFVKSNQFINRVENNIDNEESNIEKKNLKIQPLIFKQYNHTKNNYYSNSNHKFKININTFQFDTGKNLVTPHKSKSPYLIDENKNEKIHNAFLFTNRMSNFKNKFYEHHITSPNFLYIKNFNSTINKNFNNQKELNNTSSNNIPNKTSDFGASCDMNKPTYQNYISSETQTNVTTNFNLINNQSNFDQVKNVKNQDKFFQNDYLCDYLSPIILSSKNIFFMII
jgi:hypothetical protein